jgi:hypothetical protein
MNCFNHQNTAAIGTCKHCCKGLCTTCASDLGFGLACRDLHEPQVEALQAMVTRAAQVQTANRSNKYLSPIFMGVLGLLFMGSSLFEHGRAAQFALVMGACFFLYGLFLLGAVRKAYAKSEV